MDLIEYNLKDVMLTALKSEIEAEKSYLAIADRVKNIMLKDRLKFLAGEEVKHAGFIRSFFKSQFPNDEIILPEENIISLPEIKITDEHIPISELLEQAMAAEQAASNFYLAMLTLFQVDEIDQPLMLDSTESTTTISEYLLYLSTMELGHYHILKTEVDHAKENEHYTMLWDMTHVGP